MCGNERLNADPRGEQEVSKQMEGPKQAAIGNCELALDDCLNTGTIPYANWVRQEHTSKYRMCFAHAPWPSMGAQLPCTHRQLKKGIEYGAGRRSHGG